MKAQLDPTAYADADTTDAENIEANAILKLTKDLKKSAATLSKDEVRYLVDFYYQIQGERIRARSRLRAISETDQPHEVIAWLSDNTSVLEKQIARAVTAYAESILVGQWSMSIMGIGGILAAGLLAHIDIEKAPTSGHIERFGGLDPTIKWEKGQKRPYNAKLKVLFWKIGESFVKVSGNEKDFYGKIYLKEKAHLTKINEKGGFKHVAAQALIDKKYRKETEAYKAYSQGRLPLAQIHARAKRKAVKLFVSHWHEVAYRYRWGKLPPKPYVIDIMGHADYIPPPNNPFPEPKPTKGKRKK